MVITNGNSIPISALVLICFRLKKGRAAFFRPETIVASFLHLMVLFFKMLLNHLNYMLSPPCFDYFSLAGK